MSKYLISSKKFIGCCFLVILDAINVALMAVLLKQTLDAATSGSIKNLMFTASLIVIFMIEYSVVSWGTRTIKIYYISDVMFRLKEDLFSAIVNKNRSNFGEKNSAEYISLFNNELKLIEQNYFNSFFLILRSIVILIVSLAIMISIQPIVSCIAIILSFLPVLIPKLCGKSLSAITEKYTEQLKKYNRIVNDMFSGIAVIKSFELENYMSDQHKENNNMVESARRDMGKKKAVVDVFTNFIAVGMQFTVFVVAGIFVVLKKITAGDVIAITQLMNKVVNPVFDIIDSMNNMQSVKTIEKGLINIIYDKTNNMHSSEQNMEVGRIDIKNLSFAYVLEEVTIPDMTVSFERGKKYAIVGESGSGKSTLLKLVAGYLDGYTGSIYYDDVNLKEVEWKDRIKLFSVINQDIYLFEGSIRNNIIFDQQVDDSLLNEVLDKVKLNDTFKKKGTDASYQLTNNGENLSGGEREKIAIARALVRGKKWLLIDEATASMDNDTLMQIENMLLHLKDIACINITHRYNEDILKLYDEIIVLQRGKIVEKGTFEQLIKRNGVFGKLYTQDLCNVQTCDR